ncbi:MAG TPA: hypothetical protein VKE51_15435 [Vicinamibacterales bacterium]|nr:hypothetical protein [Vicinamibacterales bacterium]
MLATLTDEQMTALLTRKPKGFIANWLHALIAFVLDTGARVDEAFTVRAKAVDYDKLARDRVRQGPQGTPHPVLIRATQGPVPV